MDTFTSYYLHNTVCVGMVVDGTTLPRSPDEDKLSDTVSATSNDVVEITSTYEITLAVPFID